MESCFKTSTISFPLLLLPFLQLFCLLLTSGKIREILINWGSLFYLRQLSADRVSPASLRQSSLHKMKLQASNSQTARRKSLKLQNHSGGWIVLCVWTELSQSSASKAVLQQWSTACPARWAAAWEHGLVPCGGWRWGHCRWAGWLAAAHCLQAVGWGPLLEYLLHLIMPDTVCALWT